jgi:glutaredoxin
MEEKHHKEEHAHHAKKKYVKMKKSSMWMLISGVLAVLLIISISTGGFGRGGTSGTLSSKEAADKAITYINTNLMQPGTTASVKEVEDTGTLYNIKLDIGGREFDSYVTKDGSLLFPSVVDMSEEVEAPEQPEQPTQEPPADMAKSDKPSVELFVMSHCPFGTQAEKGIIPVAELLGDKIDFEIKFVNYAMHGEKETTEQLNQHCIKTEQGDKFLPYLKCFLKAGDGEGCLTEIGIDTAKLESCAEKTDTEFKITESLENPTGRYPAFLINDEECNEYGVRGSPTLVINGKSVSSARSPAAYLATICGAFNEAPEECDEELSAANPSSGFGYATTASSGSAAAQCG